MAARLPQLTAENAYIFRILHRANLPWTLANGLHCPNSPTRDSNFVQIGHPDIIGRRATFNVPAPGTGTLADYVPFYFTSRSPMLFNIKTGMRVKAVPNEEIVILSSSLRDLSARGISSLFTDGHALATGTSYFDDLAELCRIDWDILQRSDFARDMNDPDKMRRYEAEALIRDHLPCDALRAIACVNDSVVAAVKQEVTAAGLSVPVMTWSGGYFT